MGSFVAEAGTDVSLGKEKVKNSDENCNKVDTTDEHHGKNPRELPVVRSGEKLEENRRPVKQDWSYSEPGEPDYVQKCNGNPDAQIYENGDGDLPSFSIGRLRRLPLRGTSDQLPSAFVSTEDRNLEAVDAAYSSADSKQVRSSFDSSRSKGTSLERPLNGVEQHGGSDVQNGEIKVRNPDLENGKLAILEPGFRNPDSGEYLAVGHAKEEGSLGRAEQAEISRKPEDVGYENTSIGSNVEGRRELPQSHVSGPSPEVERGATGDGLQLSSEVRGLSDKHNLKVELGAPGVEDLHRGNNGKVREDVNLGVPIKPAELPSPAVVHILPPVTGSRFGSPGETTDEETDSPRSSEGFAYPDSDPTTLPYSGQIMYPARLSSAQASNGPGLLQYSGSMSLRSDSSTTSNRSFAFPILAPPEWNSSPARMAKAQPRRKNRFDGCCFFRLSRSRYKY